MDSTTSLSRRGALRLFGATLGVAAVGGTASGLWTPAHATTVPVALVLDQLDYQVGDVMTLTVTELLGVSRTTVITDSLGHVWTKVFDDGIRQLWQATAATAGDAVVECAVTAVATHRQPPVTETASTGYRVSSSTLISSTLIGMSSPASVWAERVAQVGTGLTARRIFANLAAGPLDKINLVEQAHADGLMPVISYKVGGDAAGAASGRFNAAAEAAAARLESYGLPASVTYWHEPHGDMSPDEFVAGNKQLLPIFKRGEIKVGPFLNGWLLDRQESAFTSYCPDELFDIWDWFGIDTYEAGTIEAPGDVQPGDRIPALAAYVGSRGITHPLGIGEYNGYTAESIVAAGEAILSEPQIWFGCMWNSTTGKGHTLEGDRLEAFRQTLADPRAATLACAPDSIPALEGDPSCGVTMP
jgi:hypothetical protein